MSMASAPAVTSTTTSGTADVAGTATYFEAHLHSETTGEELRCFRIPVTPTTTVRAFAQDCLGRFVKQTRFFSPQEVGVVDVLVNGCSLFCNDPVAAVVRPTEAIVLKLRGVSGDDIAPRRLAAQIGASTDVSPDLVVATATANKKQVSDKETKAAAVADAAKDDEEEQEEEEEPSGRKTVKAAVVKPNTKRGRQTPATEAPKADKRGPRAEAAASKGGRAAKPEPPKVVVDPLVTKARKGELQWGTQAHRKFAPNYVDDPEKLARMLRKQKKEREAAERKAAEAAAAAADDGEVTFVKEVSAEEASSKKKDEEVAAATKKKTTTAPQAKASAPMPPAAPVMRDVARQLSFV